MRRITATENLSLDGVMQSPAGTEEDTRGGFRHGGWTRPYDDQAKQNAMAASMAKRRSLLLGRRTYEHFYQTWHGRTDNPFTAVLDNTPKYVASRSLAEPLAWKNSILLRGDATDAVAALKQQPGPDLVILGSGELVRALLQRNLIDEFELLVYPVVLGSGRRLFPDEGLLTTLRLIDAMTTTKGVFIGTYETRSQI